MSARCEKREKARLLDIIDVRVGGEAKACDLIDECRRTPDVFAVRGIRDSPSNWRTFGRYGVLLGAENMRRRVLMINRRQ